MRRCFRMRKSVSHACRKGCRKVSSLARGAWQLYSSRVAEPNRSGLRAREGERLWRHGAWFLNWCWRAHCGRGWVGHASNESNTTRAARAAQGCTEDSVRMDTGGKTHERRSGEERTYRNNDCIY